MRVLDLTHTIKNDMPVYPGTEQPQLTTACTIDEVGYKETILHMYSHTGTHMDAPAHMLREGMTLDAFPAERLVGKGIVIDCRGEKEISLALLRQYDLQRIEFVLFCTGWDKLWGQDSYYEDFPVRRGGCLCGGAPSQGHWRGLHLYRSLRQPGLPQPYDTDEEELSQHGESEEFRPTDRQAIHLCRAAAEI